MKEKKNRLEIKQLHAQTGNAVRRQQGLPKFNRNKICMLFSVCTAQQSEPSCFFVDECLNNRVVNWGRWTLPIQHHLYFLGYSVDASPYNSAFL